jgi:hypothetical protein
MAETGIRVTMQVPGLERARNQFQMLPSNLAAKHMAAALKRAAEQGGTRQALRSTTPRGKTGNLRRAIAVKTKLYKRQGTGIAIVGFNSGRKMNEPFDDRKLGYHQGLVEFGTQERFRKTANGLRVPTGKMPVGGSTKRPPVRTAWDQTRSRVESLLVKELSVSFERAAKELAAQVKSLQGPF